MTSERLSSKLRFVQSLWAMEGLPRGGPEPWHLAEQLNRLVDAGFSGFAVDLGAPLAPSAEQVKLAAAGTDLSPLVFTFAGDDAELDAALTYAEQIAATDMVLCARSYTLDIDVAAERLTHWFERAAAAGVALEVETHRNTITNDLRFTSELCRHLDPRIPVSFDLSHYVVGAEIPATSTPEIDEQLGRIARRAGSVQGRVASRCQVQLPLHYDSAQPWIDLATRWWERAFVHQLERSGPEGLVFITELGPAPYAMTDAHGEELSDRWADCLALTELAEAALERAARAAVAITTPPSEPQAGT